MSEDIVGSHSGRGQVYISWAEDRNVAKNATMPRMAPHNSELSIFNVNSVKVSNKRGRRTERTDFDK